jgi:hypothetical protein
VRECLESLGVMLARVQSTGGRPNLAQVLGAARRRVENMTLEEVERRIEELLKRRIALSHSNSEG